MQSKMDRLADLAVSAGYRRQTWTGKYRSLLKGVDLQGKTVLDVGAGSGWGSFYAALRGARRVVMVEPQAEGSRGYMLELAESIRSKLELNSVVEIVPRRLEEASIEELFDVVILDNVINHLNESACLAMHHDWNARKAYWPLLNRLNALMLRRGTIVVTDCGNRNFFGDLGLRSPFAPSIEWEKHQQPEKWALLLSECGFVDPKISWSPVFRLGGVGNALARVPGSHYMTNSHFRLRMECAGEALVCNNQLNSS